MLSFLRTRLSRAWRSRRHPDNLHASADGRALIAHYVGCTFEATEREDGTLIIGYGDTEGVRPGMRILLPEADQRLQRHLARTIEPGVAAALTRPPEQHQFDALVSLAHEIGVPAFRASAVVRHFNAADLGAAAEAFGPMAAADDPLAQAQRQRRAAEQALFQGLVFVDAIRIGDATR